MVSCTAKRGGGENTHTDTHNGRARCVGVVHKVASVLVSPEPQTPQHFRVSSLGQLSRDISVYKYKCSGRTASPAEGRLPASFGGVRHRFQKGGHQAALPN